MKLSRRPIALMICISGLLTLVFTGVGSWQYASQSPTHRTRGALRTTRVGLLDESTESLRQFREILRPEDGFVCEPLSVESVRAGRIHEFDVVLVPGGKSGQQSAALGVDGRDKLRDYVRSGGGYVGICAGAFLATTDDDSMLKLINARSLSGTKEVPGWGEVDIQARRSGAVRIHLTDIGRSLLPGVSGTVEIMYSGGPILLPAGDEELSEYQTIAVYKTETWSYPFQKGTMVGTPAIATGLFGEGRVIAISPHPELSKGSEAIVKAAVLAAAKQQSETKSFKQRRPNNHVDRSTDVSRETIPPVGNPNEIIRPIHDIQRLVMTIVPATQHATIFPFVPYLTGQQKVG